MDSGITDKNAKQVNKRAKVLMSIRVRVSCGQKTTEFQILNHFLCYLESTKKRWCENDDSFAFKMWDMSIWKRRAES